jgi:hypothetical protein
LYDILHEKALNMTGSFNVIDLSRKILELSKRSRDEVININKTIYILMIIHSDRNKIHIIPNQPVLDGRSFDGNRGVTYTINSDCQIDEILMKILYLYVSNITTT